MPELPEVETIRRDLARKIVGHTIRQAEVLWHREIGYPTAEEFVGALRDRRIEEIDRRGKYLILHLSRGASMLIHLRMTGQLLYVPATEAPHKYARVIFHLDGGMDLRLCDMRKFGRVYLVEKERLKEFPKLAELGPEPLSEGFTLPVFKRLLERRTGRIKPLLMSQAFLAGMGNIYVDEALFEAGLHPLRTVESLKPKDVNRLHQAIVNVLVQSIEHRGTSVSNYRDPAGQQGYHRVHLRVFRRAGQPCYACGTPITKIRVGQRGTHFCPKCQPERKILLKPASRQHSANV